MCNYFDNRISALEVQKIFGVETGNDLEYKMLENFNGFGHSETGIITDELPNDLSLGIWGLQNVWNKDFDSTPLNAKIETIKTLPSFKNHYKKRCLVLCRGFYEWTWLDEKGKKKVKNKIFLEDSDIFALGGIYSFDHLNISFAIVTTEANQLMAKVHNNKKRMPVIIERGLEKNWLNNQDIEEFAFPFYNPKLISIPEL